LTDLGASVTFGTGISGIVCVEKMVGKVGCSFMSIMRTSKAGEIISCYFS